MGYVWYIVFWVVVIVGLLFFPHKYKKWIIYGLLFFIWFLLVKNLIDPYIECINVDILIRLLLIIGAGVVMLWMREKDFKKRKCYCYMMGCVLIFLWAWILLLAADIIRIYEYSTRSLYASENLDILSRFPMCNSFIIQSIK